VDAAVPVGDENDTDDVVSERGGRCVDHLSTA
jgi:hypothetical protein